MVYKNLIGLKYYDSAFENKSTHVVFFLKKQEFEVLMMVEI